QLLQHFKVEEAVVTANTDETGDKYLCAYIVAPPQQGATRKHRIDSSELMPYLSKVLPEYMIPSYYMQLDAIPLTTNGKTDLKALPHPELETTGYSPPRNETEEKITEIWAAILGKEKEKIGIDTHFFKAGGHSLKATAMAARIHKETDVKIPVAEIFKKPTIRELADYLRTTEKRRHHSIQPREKQQYYPLSPAQMRIYILQQMEETSTGYNMPAVFQLKGTLEKETLKKTFDGLIKRHESL
ncbi:MAG: hypothetical protein GY757_18680, partial [bacterium]|nr:hypothetical protein [bacterium]